jgi:hypothetical protein
MLARTESFALAYRMQTAAPEALDIEHESPATRTLYGLDNPVTAPYGRQCLLARRLVERGVRCVQIYSGGMDNEKSWDGHADLAGNHRGFASETDVPIAGLLSDLATAASWIRPWWCGAGNSAACRCRSAPRTARPRAATTIRTPSPPGWPAAG